MSDSSRTGAGAGGENRAPAAGTTRRQFLIGAAASAAAAWVPVFRVTPASASQECAVPPAFPAGIELFKQAWENWSREIVIDALWTCVARSAQDVVALANWAHTHGYQVRARGCGHGWSPLTITADSDCSTNVVLVDTTQFLNGLQVVAPASGVTAVRAGAGVKLDALLAFLEHNGLGLATHPATGDITLGGLLAINGHGA
ncbi:MAG: FAD-dependent oxidoreductase, partial [Hydrocarboniphaga effusa]|nr:FAD-dependent oxidoreductase [Hydrocarboniphaga effusa]